MIRNVGGIRKLPAPRPAAPGSTRSGRAQCRPCPTPRPPLPLPSRRRRPRPAQACSPASGAGRGGVAGSPTSRSSVVLVLVAALVAGVVVVRSSFPQTEGEIAVPGLEGEVEVVRDAAGHPAGVRRQLATTCSTRRASCRRRTGSTRWTSAATSPPVGSRRCSARTPSRPTSSSARWAGAGSRRRSSPCSSPATLGYLEAFSDGVNAYIESHTPSEMSLEYSVLALNGLDYAAEEWTPGRLGGLAQGDGLGPARQHGGRDQPGDPRRPAQRVRHRRAVSALPLRPAPADRRPGRRRRRRLRVRRRPQGGTRKPARPAYSPQMVARPHRPQDRARGAPRDARPRRRAGQQRLGGRRRPLHDRPADPRQRPAPRRLGARHLVPDGPALHRVSEECPFDVTGFTFAGLPGVVIGHNQDDRLGLHQPRPRRGRPLPGEDRGAALRVRRRAARPRAARRDDRGPRPRRAVHLHGALDAARAAALRRLRRAEHGRRQLPGRGRRPRARQRLRRRDGVDGAGAEQHRRRDLRPQRRPATGTSSARPPATSPSPARTWSTPTPRATSATRRPA